MRRSSFKDYPLGALMYFIKKDEYQEHFEELKKLISYGLLNKYNYNQLYLAFKSSTGVIRKVYADALISYQKENGYFIENDIMDEIISYASFEDLWYLSKNAVNPFVQLKCFQQVCSIIDETFEKADLEKMKIRRMRKNEKY